MANRAGSSPTFHRGHPGWACRVDRRRTKLGEHQSDRSNGLAGLSMAALGVVFGDIGTSPVYTFRECFNPEHGLPLDAEHVLGVLSMIFWALIIVVAVKYVLLIMRADNQRRGWHSCLARLSPGSRPRRALAHSLGPARARRCRAVFRRQYDHAGNFRTQRRRRHWHCDAGAKPVRPAADSRRAARTFPLSEGRHRTRRPPLWPGDGVMVRRHRGNRRGPDRRSPACARRR